MHRAAKSQLIFWTRRWIFLCSIYLIIFLTKFVCVFLKLFYFAFKTPFRCNKAPQKYYSNCVLIKNVLPKYSLLIFGKVFNEIYLSHTLDIHSISPVEMMQSTTCEQHVYVDMKSRQI